MPARRIRVAPAAALRKGLEAIRREAGVPSSFPPAVQAEADAAANRPSETVTRTVAFSLDR